jgi:hypothetical protein
MAHYLDIPCTTLARAMCNRGTLEKLPLPAAVDDAYVSPSMVEQPGRCFFDRDQPKP